MITAFVNQNLFLNLSTYFWVKAWRFAISSFPYKKSWFLVECNTKRVTLVYLYHVNRCGTHKKLSIAKLDFVQVCGLSLNYYSNTLRKFYKFSDSRPTWASPTLQWWIDQSADNITGLKCARECLILKYIIISRILGSTIVNWFSDLFPFQKCTKIAVLLIV